MNLQRSWICRGVFLLIMSTSLVSCANRYQMIGAGMVGGAAVGAGAGYLFVHHGQNKQYEVRNTIITSVVFALVSGGLLALHYRALEQQRLEISGQYARYRLCNPETDDCRPPSLDSESVSMNPRGRSFRLTDEMIQEKSIQLDESTKWLFPVFRKRYVPAEGGTDSVVSSRQIWEIVKPGRFIKRSKNPDYFLNIETEEPSNESQ